MYFFAGHSWVTANRNVSKFGRSQAILNGGKINENARVNAEATLRKELRQDLKTFIHRFDSDRRLQNFNTTSFKNPL
jgi:hypothetical protein